MQACEWRNKLQDGEPRAKLLAVVINNDCVDSYKLLLSRLGIAVRRLLQQLTLSWPPFSYKFFTSGCASIRIVRVFSIEHRLWVLDRVAAIVSLLLSRGGHIPHGMPTDQGTRFWVLGYPMVVIAYKGEDRLSGRGSHCGFDRCYLSLQLVLGLKSRQYVRVTYDNGTVPFRAPVLMRWREQNFYLRPKFVRQTES